VAKWAPPPFGHVGYWGFRPKHHDTQGILTQPYPDLPVFNVSPPWPDWRHGQYFSQPPDYYQVWLNLLVLAAMRKIMPFDIAEVEDTLKQHLANPA